MNNKSYVTLTDGQIRSLNDMVKGREAQEIDVHPMTLGIVEYVVWSDAADEPVESGYIRPSGSVQMREQDQAA